MVSGRGKREKAVGIFFFFLENNLKQFYSSWGILLLSSLLPILHFFFFYLRNWSSEVIINLSCKMFFTGGLQILGEFLFYS